MLNVEFPRSPHPQDSLIGIIYSAKDKVYLQILKSYLQITLKDTLFTDYKKCIDFLIDTVML